MKLLIAALGAAFVLLALSGTPASAGPPITFTDTVTFVDVNPCSGEDHEVTLIFDIAVHEGHPNNLVAHVQRSGTTSSGYTMIAGTESFVENDHVMRGAFVDQWAHPDGSRFRVRGNFTVNLEVGEGLVDNFSLVCIGNT